MPPRGGGVFTFGALQETARHGAHATPEWRNAGKSQGRLPTKMQSPHSTESYGRGTAKCRSASSYHRVPKERPEPLAGWPTAMQPCNEGGREPSPIVPSARSSLRRHGAHVHCVRTKPQKSACARVDGPWRPARCGARQSRALRGAPGQSMAAAWPAAGHC